jgi:hypothetical protein
MYRSHHRVAAGIAVALTLLGGARSIAEAQARPDTTVRLNWSQKRNYSGPRFGVTILAPAMVDSLKSKYDINVGTVITQFGWQFEREFYSVEGGPVALNEWAVLVGGLESGVFLPSISWLVGVRGQSGVEVGVGPNLTPAGVALAMAVGVNVRSGGMNFPVNVAAVSSKVGMRISFLAGFTLR